MPASRRSAASTSDYAETENSRWAAAARSSTSGPSKSRPPPSTPLTSDYRGNATARSPISGSSSSNSPVFGPSPFKPPSSQSSSSANGLASAKMELVGKLMSLKQNDTSGIHFNAALKDLIKITEQVSGWEIKATSNDGALIHDICFLHRCRVIKSELDSLIRKLPNRKEFKPEDKEICKMLAFQIGRLKMYSSVESRDLDSRNGPDFRVEAADSCMADFTSAIYDRELRKGAGFPKAAHTSPLDTWERMHFKYPGCTCVQCRDFKVRSSVYARNIVRIGWK